MHSPPAIIVPVEVTAGHLVISQYEAERQQTSGTQFGPERRLGTIAAEASGRRAVLLENQQQSVDIVLDVPARGFTVRYALADSADGKGQDSTAILEQGGRLIATIDLTSRYSVFYGAYPFSNRPSGGGARHFWDETRVLLPTTLPAGTRVSIRPAAGSLGFALDFIETEPVAPPLAEPLNAISVVQFGADPSGQRSSKNAFERAILAARRTSKVVYVPAGRYKVDGHLVVDRVKIVGAGLWHTTLAGHHVGLHSRPEGSSGVSLSDFALESDVAERRDRLPLAAIGGKFSNSVFDNLYLHHAKVGIWLDGPAHDLSITNVRIADQAADGINLHRGITRAVVEYNRIRNVGDDGIASWSEHVANRDISIRYNQVIAPTLANGIALYGGHNIDVSNNWIADTLTEGGGIHLGARFKSASFSGRIRIENNTIVRSGSMDPHWNFGIGSIWIYALEKPIAARITIANNRVEDAGCEVVQLLGPHRIDGVSVNRLTVLGPVSTIFALQTTGTMTVQDVQSGGEPTTVEKPAGFQLDLGPGNQGWISKQVARPSRPTCKLSWPEQPVAGARDHVG